MATYLHPKSRRSSIIFLIIVFAISSTCSSASPASIPLFRNQLFSRVAPESAETISSNMLKDLKGFVYNQTLDHFSYTPESYRTFPHRYYVKDTYWGGRNSPIFVYFGDEHEIDLQLGNFNVGFLEEHAPRFKALIIYIEHRFYGKSNPLGSMEESIKNPKIRGYFNSAQALADYAELILHLKKQYSAQHSPVIAFGVSYAGMLAAYFRLKYPHVAMGALASSAPILQDAKSTDTYLQVASKVYRDTSENCYQTIKQSWDDMDALLSQSDGLSILNQKFKTCRPLSLSELVVDFLFSIYVQAAQYDFPPYNPVEAICKGIDGAPKGASSIDKVFDGLISLLGNLTCFNGNEASVVPSADDGISDFSLGWPWQLCSDLVYFQQTVNDNDTTSMFPFIPSFNLKAKLQQCKRNYGVLPRPNWMETYYGGQDIKLVLKRFGSNIIFSNGLRDPWSGLGVVEDLSSSLLAVVTAQGAHGLDTRHTLKDDPEWLTKMRKRELEIIQGWLNQYYADLHTLI